MGISCRVQIDHQFSHDLLPGKFVEKLGLISYRCFSPFLVPYDDNIIESKYFKSGMLTLQDGYKGEIVLVVVDIEGCDIIPRRQWPEAKNVFLAV